MGKPTLDDVVTRYEDTGNCEIDCDVVARLWGSLWMLSQWNDEFKLVKLKRKDSQIASIKVSIAEDQAQELIGRLNLQGWKHSLFPSGTSWRSS